VSLKISRDVADEIKQLREGRNGKKLYGKKLYGESNALKQNIIETLTFKAEGMYVAVREVDAPRFGRWLISR
jgi:hypothetical protein